MNLKKISVSILSVSLLSQAGFSETAKAGSGADALLQSTGASSAVLETLKADESKVVIPVVQEEIKLSNAVAKALFADWSSVQGLSFDQNAWAKNFFFDRFEPVAHLWTVMGSGFPRALEHSSKAAYLYSLYKLGAHQTFFDSWMDALSNQSFRDSKAGLALEEVLAPEFDRWFLTHGVQINPLQTEMIKGLNMSRGSLALSLNAAILRRKGEAGLSVLEKLPINNAFRPLLARTVSLSLAKKGDISGAAKVLKLYYEPWIVASKNPRELAKHYLQIARLLYQVGSLDGAMEFYQKIPNGIPEYLTSQEELSWVWLRQGQNERLRGMLSTLTSKVLSESFRPEAYLVRAISNLKFCFYADVEKDFSDFTSTQAGWAKKIDQAIASSDPVMPRESDDFSTFAAVSEKERTLEMALLNGLSERSISAVLPAVGPQKHWGVAVEKMKLSLENAKKTVSDEYRRQWKNDRMELLEAIQKMKFVKIELLSQIQKRIAQMGDAVQSDQVVAQSAAPAREPQRVGTGNENEMSFPFDGVIWPDELFKLRSLARGQCAGM